METYYNPEDLASLGQSGKKHQSWQKNSLLITMRYSKRVR